jgi:hypothetical protein
LSTPDKPGLSLESRESSHEKYYDLRVCANRSPIVALAAGGKVHKSGDHAGFVVALDEAKGLLDI